MPSNALVYEMYWFYYNMIHLNNTQILSTYITYNKHNTLVNLQLYHKLYQVCILLYSYQYVTLSKYVYYYTLIIHFVALKYKCLGAWQLSLHKFGAT